MRKFLMLLTACLLLPLTAAADGLSFQTAPEVLRPGKLYEIVVHAPQDGMLTLTLVDAAGTAVYTVYDEYPATTGENKLHWDGLRTDASVMPAGEYRLHVQSNGQEAASAVRIGAPYPILSQVEQSDGAVIDIPVEIRFTASDAGEVTIQLRDNAERTVSHLARLQTAAGENRWQWDGTMNGAPVADGAYALILTLRAQNGTESMPQYTTIQVGEKPVPTEAPAPTAEAPIQSAPESDAAAQLAAGQSGAQAESAAEGITAEWTTAPAGGAASGDTSFSELTSGEAPSDEAGAKSPPYSALQDGTFWSMTPGETDDAVIWDILTQPITVYDGGLDQRDHVYLMENPDGTGAQLAQIHGQSQGLHILSEENEHGYVLAEAFSSYDDKYFPDTDEEKARAFDVKRGYIKAAGLKTIEVQQDMALLIDKKSQRMYLFKDGERVTEFLICTGIIANDKYYYETTPGEFITVSHSGGFYSGKYMYCDMAIRINGGILLHEVPYEPLGDGSKRYTQYEALLGTKASHGCIRIQRQETPEGYNHRWLWENLRHGTPYKVIIWDDLGRVDEPATWQPNPG